MLAAVAGIMTWITLHELLPAAFAHAGREGTIVSFFTGAHWCRSPLGKDLVLQ